MAAKTTVLVVLLSLAAVGTACGENGVTPEACPPLPLDTDPDLIGVAGAEAIDAIQETKFAAAVAADCATPIGTAVSGTLTGGGGTTGSGGTRNGSGGSG